MIQTIDVTFGIENTDIKHRVVGDDQGILQDLAEFIIVVDKFVLIFDIPLGNAVNMGIGEKVVTEMRLEVPFKVVNDLPFFIDRNAQRTGGCRTGIGRFKIESDDFHCRFFLFLSFRKRFISCPAYRPCGEARYFERYSLSSRRGHFLKVSATSS